ncbi:MAG: hypothetical protein ACL7AY_03085 [Candidatus Arsenophonus phytopathogenicus]
MTLHSPKNDYIQQLNTHIKNSVFLVPNNFGVIAMKIFHTLYIDDGSVDYVQSSIGAKIPYCACYKK